MITQLELDKCMQAVQAGKDVYMYYVAHCIELREGIADEHRYKSINRFRIIQIKFLGAENAYFEYMKYKEHPLDFHEEQEVEYYDEFTKYVHRYKVPNKGASYPKDYNSAYPSIIYGTVQEIYHYNTGTTEVIENPSIIDVKYVINPEYADQPGTADFNNGKLNWKYRRAPFSTIMDDNVEYNYITSDWYILDIENFPRTEKPLINVNQKNAYFMELTDALNYMRQLEA